MKNVCIIGAGQLGSRHLQALKPLKKTLNIFVVDPSEESLRIAKARYEEFPHQGGAHNLNYSVGYDELPIDVEIAIVSTGSAGRKRCIEELLKASNVNYLILEKLLFQTINEIESVSKTLENNNVKAWVNCPRRMMIFYEELKKDFEGNPIHYQLSGSNFGLISNLIHFIDVMIYITQCKDFELDLLRLNKQVMKSKREGYFELSGEITVTFSDDSIGNFICFPNGNLALEFQIFNNNKRAKINESQGILSWSKWNNKEGKLEYIDESILIPYQSQMTTILAEELLHKR